MIQKESERMRTNKGESTNQSHSNGSKEGKHRKTAAPPLCLKCRLLIGHVSSDDRDDHGIWGVGGVWASLKSPESDAHDHSLGNRKEHTPPRTVHGMCVLLGVCCVCACYLSHFVMCVRNRIVCVVV